jgi:hypothetical protein
MLSLMLYLRFKNLHLISSFISCEGVVIVEEYDKKCLYLMLIKCHDHLHHVSKCKLGYANPMVKDCNLDIFEQTISTNELMKELVDKTLQIFKRHQVKIKDIKCPF